MNQSRGVLYQATGLKRYVAFCACSVRSLRWSGYTGPIRVLVDDPDLPLSLFEGLDVELRVVSVPSGRRMCARSIKTRLHEYSFAQTLYLDCDVIVSNSMDGVWSEMGEADLALAPCYFEVEKSVHATPDELRYTLAQGIRGVQYNGGVMAWRDNESARAFFEAWHSEWQLFGHIDQLALLRALRQVRLQLHTLPSRFNYLEDGSALQVKNHGVVFWHPSGGRDTPAFRVTFGEVFEQQCCSLGLRPQDMGTTYHAQIQRNLLSLKTKHRVRSSGESVLNFLRSAKHQLRYGRKTGKT